MGERVDPPAVAGSVQQVVVPQRGPSGWLSFALTALGAAIAAATIVYSAGGQGERLASSERRVAQMEVQLAEEVAKRDAADTAMKARIEANQAEAQRATDLSRQERNRELGAYQDRLAHLAREVGEMRGETRAWIAAQERWNASMAGWMSRQEERLNRGTLPRPGSWDEPTPSSAEMWALLPYVSPRLPWVSPHGAVPAPAPAGTVIPPRTYQEIAQ